MSKMGLWCLLPVHLRGAALFWSYQENVPAFPREKEKSVFSEQHNVDMCLYFPSFSKPRNKIPTLTKTKILII